jgi:lipopolysaccharide export LptBFGC system permease protein LptF
VNRAQPAVEIALVVLALTASVPSNKMVQTIALVLLGLLALAYVIVSRITK